MSFFSDIGDAVKRTFANPSKLVADVSTFGTTAVLRALPKSFGGGQSGIFSKSSEVIGSTTIGVGVGYATGGFPGAVVGGASGFGRGVSGVVNNESGKNIAGGAAKWSAITGSFTGAIRGTGAAGFVRNQIITGAAKVPAIPKITVPSVAGFSTAALSASTLLASLRPGTSSVNVSPPGNPNAGTGTHSPQTVNVDNPSATPSAAPSAAAPSSIAVIPVGSGTAPFPWWILAVAAGALYLYFKKKAHHK